MSVVLALESNSTPPRLPYTPSLMPMAFRFIFIFSLPQQRQRQEETATLGMLTGSLSRFVFACAT